MDTDLTRRGERGVEETQGKDAGATLGRLGRRAQV